MLAKRVSLRIFLRAAIACLALGTSSLFAGVDVVDFQMSRCVRATSS